MATKETVATKDIYCTKCRTKRTHKFSKGTLENLGKDEKTGKVKYRQTVKGGYSIKTVGNVKMARGMCGTCGTQTSLIIEHVK